MSASDNDVGEQRRGFSHDFSNDGLLLSELYEHGYAREAVTVALDTIATRKAGSPRSQLTALQASRALLYAFASEHGCTEKTMKALETIALTIMEAEKVLRIAVAKEKKKEKKKGGRPFKGTSLHQRMAVKLAVEWLTQLTPPMSLEDATTVVAACVPQELVTRRKKHTTKRRARAKSPQPPLSPRDQVKEWREEYDKQIKGTRERKSGSLYRRALSDVAFDRFEQFEDRWQIAGQSDTGEWLYSDHMCERTYLDVSPQQVLAWVKARLTEPAANDSR